MNKNNPILQKSFQFSLDIIEYTEMLTNLKKYNLANQLFSKRDCNRCYGKRSTKSRINE